MSHDVNPKNGPGDSHHNEKQKLVAKVKKLRRGVTWVMKIVRREGVGGRGRQFSP